MKPMSVGAIEVLKQLWNTGPVWDGNIIDKCGRQELFDLGLADRTNGYSFLTKAGVHLSADVVYEMQEKI
jgi:hypothetical protein